MPIKRTRPRKRDGEEYRFRIDAWTPAKIPMLRLAEYMRELAQILGEPTQVHFRRLVRGSTVIVHQIEREAVPKVFERVSQVRLGEGPSEALRSYKAVNRLLREDNAVGALKNRKLLLRFPGREETQEAFAAVRQQGSLDGIITGVRGRDQTAHITLQDGERQISGCWTNRTIAKQLGAKLWEPVRLFGRGRWRRDEEGIWTLVDFKVEGFEPLDDAPLSDALANLRRIPTQWDDNAYKDLTMIRRGGNGNGGR